MKLIAHRGGAGLRVENTLAAFGNAIDLGADGAELDVHLTRDGEVVVHHDGSVGFASHELKTLAKMVTEHQTRFEEAWNEFFAR